MRNAHSTICVMTFSRWRIRSSSYKPLESRFKRRNTIGAIRISRKKQQNSNTEFALAATPSTDTTASPRAPAENETTTSNGHVPQPLSDDTFTHEHCRSPPPTARRTPQRTRCFSTPGPGWTATLRSRLSLRRRRHAGSRQLRSSLSPSPEPEVFSDVDVGDVAGSAESAENGTDDLVPEKSDEELDALLQNAWSSVLAVAEANCTGFLRRKQALEYGRKMSDLRHQYNVKSAEILQREATFVQELLSHDETTPLIRAEELTSPIELQQAVHDAQTSGKFAKLRRELKKETAVSILALQSRYQTLLATQGVHADSPRSQRSVSCQWPSQTLVYCNPQAHSEAIQSGSMVAVCNGFYATENFINDERSSEPEDVLP